MEEKKFHCHCFGTTRATEVVQFYFRHYGTTAALPADDLAEYMYVGPKKKPCFDNFFILLSEGCPL